MRKSKALERQRLNGELNLIIEEFGRAMWNANRKFVSREPECHHDDAPRFTLNMQMIWYKYIAFCQRNPE